ncbi:MAG TPA: hypothetical protein VEB21_12550 [Terriglobales bacterium]|nr:hypothetical protein [Terriglobales bacterium]
MRIIGIDWRLCALLVVLFMVGLFQIYVSRRISAQQLVSEACPVTTLQDKLTGHTLGPDAAVVALSNAFTIIDSQDEAIAGLKDAAWNVGVVTLILTAQLFAVLRAARGDPATSHRAP